MVIEASGSPRAISQAFSLVRTGGRICAIGISGKAEISIPWDRAIDKVIDVIFNMSSSYTSWPKALSTLASYQKVLAPYVSAIVELQDWEKSFVRLEEEQEVKVLFRL
jgi:L-iditol 2-dehydrogenase